MRFIDFIKKRKDVVHQESEGINLAIFSINEFVHRRFFFKGLRNRYCGICGEELLRRLQEEMNSMLIFYRYTTKVKKYTDRKGVSQMQIRLIGRASMMNRYNPLDTEMCIETET